MALQQLKGCSVIGLAGCSNFINNINPPSICRRLILAPDADKAGRDAINAAIPRLHRRGIEAGSFLPPPGMDWVDVLSDFEEEKAIKEIR